MPVFVLPKPWRVDDVRSCGLVGVSQRRSRAGSAVSIWRTNGGFLSLPRLWSVRGRPHGDGRDEIGNPECVVVEAAAHRLTGGRTHRLWGRDGGHSALAPRGALDAGTGGECLKGWCRSTVVRSRP